MNANQNLIAQVRAYAEQHYSAGWDVVVECYEENDIAEVIGKARTLSGALRKFADIVSHHRELIAEAGLYREDPKVAARKMAEDFLAIEREAAAKEAADQRAWLDLMFPDNDDGGYFREPCADDFC